jgi:DNA-directed RNA polymerase specialized sigma24 family protein
MSTDLEREFGEVEQEVTAAVERTLEDLEATREAVGRYAVRLIRDEQEANDTVQDAYCSVIESGKYKKTALDLEKYMRGAVRWSWVNRRRKKSRAPATVPYEDVSESPHPGPEVAVMCRELGEAVVAELERLRDSLPVLDSKRKVIEALLLYGNDNAAIGIYIGKNAADTRRAKKECLDWVRPRMNPSLAPSILPLFGCDGISRAVMGLIAAVIAFFMLAFTSADVRTGSVANGPVRNLGNFNAGPPVDAGRVVAAGQAGKPGNQKAQGFAAGGDAAGVGLALAPDPKPGGLVGPIKGADQIP